MKKHNKKLQKQLDELILSKQKNTYNHISVAFDDYENTPPKALIEILDNCSIVVIGLNEHDNAYHFFSKLHKNLKIIDGFTKSYDPKLIKKTKFVFKIIGFMSHTVGFRAKNELCDKPYCELQNHKNTNLLMNAIANVLCRYFNLKK